MCWFAALAAHVWRPMPCQCRYICIWGIQYPLTWFRINSIFRRVQTWIATVPRAFFTGKCHRMDGHLHSTIRLVKRWMDGIVDKINLILNIFTAIRSLSATSSHSEIGAWAPESSAARISDTTSHAQAKWIYRNWNQFFLHRFRFGHSVNVYNQRVFSFFFWEKNVYISVPIKNESYVGLWIFWERVPMFVNGEFRMCETKKGRFQCFQPIPHPLDADAVVAPAQLIWSEDRSFWTSRFALLSQFTYCANVNTKYVHIAACNLYHIRPQFVVGSILFRNKHRFQIHFALELTRNSHSRIYAFSAAIAIWISFWASAILHKILYGVVGLYSLCHLKPHWHQPISSPKLRRRYYVKSPSFGHTNLSSSKM